MKKKQLVLIGGGHAHMLLLANLREFVKKGIEVTVVQPSPHHYYSGMGAGMLGDTYSAEEIRFHTRAVVEQQGARFVLGRVSRINPASQEVLLEDSASTIRYDLLSCNAGSQVPGTIVTGSGSDVFPVKPIEGLLTAKKRLLELCRERSIQIGIVGGGPSAVEIAGNIEHLARRHGLHPPKITIAAGHSLLPHAPDRVRRLAENRLISRNIEILTNRRVQEINSGRLLFTDGELLNTDVVFLAMGVKPSPIFARSGLPVGPDGGLRVNEYLQSVAHADIFGGGDCIFFEPRPLNKVGVYAVRQNPTLYHNVLAAVEGRALQPFNPGGAYLLIYNLGDGYGIFSKWSIAFAGRTAFRLKDYIDRKFIQRFQALEA